MTTNDWLLTAGNGRGDATFDLRMGIGRPADPRDLITKAAACAVAPPGTPHPIWTAFLERVAPDPDLRAFLKRFCGYCLTGATSEHKFVFVYGTGANGKSTFMNTVAGIFGEYATIADVGTFMAAAHERHPTDIAKLHGYRLVVAQETEKGRRWDDTKIKSMTGGDRTEERRVGQDCVDFTPKFKLWEIVNHKPRLGNVNEVYGTGANGTTTFMISVAGNFEDYATIAEVGTFRAASRARHPTDIAKLHGYRLVVAQETEKGRRWDDTKIKSMTGGDKMTARFMRQDFFDFTPKFKLWVIGNHKPRLGNVDEAMRRRLLLVPV